MSVLGLFMTLATTLAQPLREGATPPEPPALRARKATTPFVGVTVNIPLWKLLGKKKAKALPVAPKLDVVSYYEDKRLSILPLPMNSDGVIITPGLPHMPLGTPTRWDPECQCTVIDTDVTIYPDYSGGGGGGGLPGSGGGGSAPADQDQAPPGAEGGNGSASGPEPNRDTPSLDDLNCGAYQSFFQKSVVSGKEQGGLITADGKIISLPTKDNTHTTVSWKNNYENQNGDRTVRIKQQDDGSWQVIIFDPADPFGSPIYIGQIVAMIHTHPTLPNNNAGTYLPSNNDMYVASQYPGLRQFVQYETGTFEFDNNGSIQCNSLPNCPVP